MTTTTPESRARIAYTAYLRAQFGGAPIPETVRTFEQLTDGERAGWMKSAGVIWDLATTGQATL